ncbi:MAG TPA: alpha/beta fold hydrolase [Steroidobacteraceae bacterium]|nr:alpha/beta fold hydrolase [Steroidobacteraceae bacterium]
MHWPGSERISDLGLVICKPFGYEALCAHRSLRAFAQAAAESGIPTLSFDYLGTGDSADIDADADQIERWCEDVVCAVGELRRRTGVRRVCLLGFRLGALLASLAARRTTVDALILVAPVVRGRLYARELRTTEAMAMRAGPKTAANDTSRGSASDGSMEVGGYYLSAQTIARLGQIDLAALGTPPVAALLVIDRIGLPEARAWAQSLSGCVTQLDYLALSGFVEMMMTPPPFTRIPQAMIGSVKEWLVHLASSSTNLPASGFGTAYPAVAPRMVLTLASSGTSPDSLPSEWPARFGPDGALFGIVTEPHDTLRRAAIVLVNAGADSHVCVGRLYVELARQWAESGYVVLRMDLAGLGDSHARPGRPDNEVYPPAAVDDIRAAIAFMRSRFGVDDVTLGGLCSGAYHTLRAAVEAVPLNRIFLVNPQVFFWREGTSLEDIQMPEIMSAESVYGERMCSFKYWKKLLTGQVDVGHIARVYQRRVMFGLATRLRDAARHLRIRLPNDLGWELEQIARRGVRITIVFARGEPGLELLQRQGGSSVKRLGNRCRLHIIDGADHTFSRRASRPALEMVLREALAERLPAA